MICEEVCLCMCKKGQPIAYKEFPYKLFCKCKKCMYICLNVHFKLFYKSKKYMYVLVFILNISINKKYMYVYMNVQLYA